MAPFLKCGRPVWGAQEQVLIRRLGHWRVALPAAVFGQRRKPSSSDAPALGLLL